MRMTKVLYLIQNMDRRSSTTSEIEETSAETNAFLNEDLSETNQIVLIRSVFEMFATFLFIFLIILCQKEIQKFILGMWVILIVFGNFSGPHLNPAISLGFYINKARYGLGFIKFAMFVVAQILGCYVGVAVSYSITGKIDFIDIPNDNNIFQIFIGELFFTGTLFFIIIFVSYKETQPSNKSYINATFIVSWFYVIVSAGNLISGAAYNPAVLFTLNSFAIAIGKNEEAKNDFSKLIMMIIAQFSGVAIFAFIYKAFAETFHEADVKKSNAVRDSENMAELNAIN